MEIHIKTEHNVPIYEQITNQIKTKIGRGDLQPHTQMPSIRLLAKNLKVSVITTKRAYEELEQAGYLYTIPGKGSYVADISKAIILNDAVKTIETHLAAIELVADQSGIPQDTLNELIMKWVRKTQD